MDEEIEVPPVLIELESLLTNIKADRLLLFLIRLKHKDLALVFPYLIAIIFRFDGVGWGLHSLHSELQETRELYEFLRPNKIIFHICYKLLADPQCKFTFPVDLLPEEVSQILESERIPEYYMDLININPDTYRIDSLQLNAFEYYIFHFACYGRGLPYFTNNIYGECSYYNLACEYFAHFLPTHNDQEVTPRLPYLSEKTSMRVPDGRFHPRGEMWRSETVMQVFTDIWLRSSFNNCLMSRFTRHHSIEIEFIRLAQAFIEQCHAFSFNNTNDLTSLGELRRAARTIYIPQASSFVSRALCTWPLEFSFSLVFELWLNFLQPWKYVLPKNSNTRSNGRGRRTIDEIYIPFISDNILVYTEVFPLVVSRLFNMNLTDQCNAKMVYTLAKAFSQKNIIQLLINEEKKLMNDDNQTILHLCVIFDSVDKMNTMFNPYQPLLLEKNQYMGKGLQKSIIKALSDFFENLQLREEQIKNMRKNGEVSKNFTLRFEKTPFYLHGAVIHFCQIFSLKPNSYMADEGNNCTLNKNVYKSVNYDIQSLSKSVREHHRNAKYIRQSAYHSYENVFVVKKLYYISTRMNRMFHQQIENLYTREDLVGSILKHAFKGLVTKTSPPRFCLRHFGSYTSLFWISIFCFLCHTGFNVTVQFIMFFWLYYLFVLPVVEWYQPREPKEVEAYLVDYDSPILKQMREG